MKIIKVKILEREFEGDFLNPDVIEQREAAIEKVKKQLEEDMPEGAKGIRLLCDMTCSCADEILGAGASEKLFPDGRDLLSCLDLFKELCEMEDKQLTPLINDRRMRYSAERARRGTKSAY